MTEYKRITEIHFNWFTTSENGEEVTVVKLFDEYHNKQVVEIQEHIPQGEGDRLWYDLIYHSRKESVRIFNPNLVKYDTALK